MTNKVMDDMSLKLLVVAAILAAITATSEQQAISGCKENCGNLRIPFPFGIENGCYLNEKFKITCNVSGAFHSDTGIQVLNISLDGQMRVSSEVAYDCYDKDGNKTTYKRSRFKDSKFPISHSHNKFTAVGCDTYAYIQGVTGHRYATGCISFCDQKNDVVNGSCGGIGCCQTSIPEGVWDFRAGVDSYYNHVYVFDYNPCSYAFLVDENSYNFSFLDLPDLQNVHSFPVVLDWAIGNETCFVAKKEPETYACKGNSTCIDSDNGPGYRCSCPDGHTGNPYIVNGCQDTDECSDARLHQCAQKCTNTIGNYTCSCLKGFHGDGRKDGSGCIPNGKSQVGTIVGVSTSLTGLFMVLALAFFGQQKRRMVKARKEYFKHNGGYLLQQLLFTRKSSNNAAKIFTEEELKKATNNFNKTMVVGQGGYGVVYKGMLSEGHIVAIKKSKAIDSSQIQQFVNEVIVLSQINHPNTVKLLGCCLETHVPLLVYEFINNGTLFHHIHSAEESMPWGMRLRIAEETAGALAYMHSLQIIHRDVKSANILLDENYTAKVSDFGVSRLVPFEQDQISTLVQGTLGYMDPEYFRSGILTEKSDVYSFGVVLVELLTGKKAICSECVEKSLALYFISSLKENRLHDILENGIRKEGEEEQFLGIAELARKCLRLEGDQRPTMKQVAEELDNLKQFGEKSPMKLQHSSDGGKVYSTFNSLDEINSFNSFQIEVAHRKIAEILNSRAAS